MRVRQWSLAALAVAFSGAASWGLATQAPAPPAQAAGAFDNEIEKHSRRLFEDGRKIFRFDTFGSEAFWGSQLRLHEAIVGQANGGTGAGVSPRTALKLGLKVDAAALPAPVVKGIQGGTISLDDPATTVELLKLNAVVGVTGLFDAQKKRVISMGIQCALCHSNVDDSFSPGIGRRLDGWPNRDLDIGAIVASAPTVKPFADLLGVDEATVVKVLKSWGPGKYDAELSQDGKAMRPDGKSAATLLPAAFGLAGVNLHTYTGWGSVPYWNAYVANTQMHGQGTFFDPRLNDKDRFPVAVKAGSHDVRGKPDLVTGKLAALHYYQISIPAPRPKAGSFDAAAATRGKAVFEGKAQCATCHVPPLFTEPGWAMHTAEEMGIDDFQASRSPDKKFYRTTPLAGLFTRTKGGFYHDGRFADLRAVVAHYNGKRNLRLSDAESADLIEYLKSL